MSRKDWTELCYPDPISLSDFSAQVKGSVDIFAANMKNLNKDTDRNAEDWMKLFAGWMEMV